jgi:O-antigen/teichoic acid export membrane protein
LNADRFFLVQHSGIEILGIFSLAAKVAGIVGMLAFAPLYKSWSAHMYVVFAGHDAERQAGRWFTLMLFPSCYLGLAVSLFQGELIQTLSATAYHDAQFWVAPLVLCGIFVNAQVLTDGPIYARRRTGLKPFVTGSIAVITVLSMAILTPRLQLLGVIMALLISASTLWALTYVVARRIMRIDYEWRRLLIMIGSGILFALPTYLTSPGNLQSILWKVSLLALWPAVLSGFGFFSRSEKDRVKSTLRKLLQRPQYWSQSPRNTNEKSLR